MLCALAACSPPKPSAEELAEIARLDSLRAEIADDIERARDDELQWAGGLVGVLASARRQVLETTDAMLLQRIEALKAGARFAHTVVTPPRDSARAEALAREIEVKRAELSDAELEAARYSGGLLEGLARMRAMTLQQTLTMLDQSRLSALYGLPIPQSDSIQVATSRPATTTGRSPPQAPASPRAAPSPTPAFDIVDVSTRVTEQNEVFWRYAWRLTLKSRAATPLSLDATIEFQDGDGFVIDTDDEYNLYLEPGEQKTFTGFAMITSSTAASIARVNAKVRR